MDIVLIHGYNVTSTGTYGVLPLRLKSLGHNIKNVYLSKYVTLDDDITLSDIVRAFQAALVDTLGPQFEKKKFACVTHSTGGLVARAWVNTYYGSRPKSIPISHLIMLAPPNHGSRLSSLGKSRLSRLRSLWGTEPGLKVLDALDLGSEYQWQLNTDWIEKELHKAPGFFPVVIAGQWIDKKLWDVIIPATYERGSDGVVRAAAANLNMQKFILGDDGRIASEEMSGIPFLITPKTAHADETYGIMSSVPSKGDHPVLSAITQVLDVETRKEYQSLAADWADKTNRLQQQETYYDGTHLDQYCQIVFKIFDSNGDPVPDYAIELIDYEGRGDRFPSGFLSNATQNSVNSNMYVMYLDYNQIAKVVGGKVGFRIQSVPDTPLIQYAETKLLDDTAHVGQYLSPNQTTYMQVVMRRRVNKNTFRLTKNLSYQKITDTSSDDWIE